MADRTPDKWDHQDREERIAVSGWSAESSYLEVRNEERILRVSWTTRSNQSILKEISPEYSLEGLMLNLKKLQYFGHLVGRTDSLEKTLMVGKIEGRRRRGATEDEMVGWHHWLNGHEFEQAPGIGDGQGNLECCSAWGCKELDMTELLNWVGELDKFLRVQFLQKGGRIMLSAAEFQRSTGVAPHSSTLAWKVPWAEEPGGLHSMGLLRVRHDWATSLSLFTYMHWRRKWQLTPVFLSGESQGQGSWWAAVFVVAQSRTRLKRLSSSSSWGVEDKLSLLGCRR